MFPEVFRRCPFRNPLVADIIPIFEAKDLTQQISTRIVVEPETGRGLDRKP